MLKVALSMLLHKKPRLIVTVAGIAVAFFLCAAQVGLLVGWCRTTSALVRFTDADIWVMAERTPAYDYGTAIPRNRIYQVRSVEGVAWAEGLYMDWLYWQRPDGRRMHVELVGLDGDLAGGPWEMNEGPLAAVHQPDTVVVDALYLEALGVQGVGEEVEMQGRRARVGAISSGVRTFTASPFVFTSLESAIKYDARYKDDEVTYVLARCAPGRDAAEVRAAIARQVPDVEVLTKAEFAVRTIKYWMLETGVGITVVVTAVLGLLVATIIVSQTLFAITQDHLENYATLLALGFRRRRLVAIVAAQSLLLSICGMTLGSIAFFYASQLTAATAIPLQTNGVVFSGLVLISILCCVVASFLAVRTVLNTDPVTVFRA